MIEDESEIDSLFDDGDKRETLEADAVKTLKHDFYKSILDKTEVKLKTSTGSNTRNTDDEKKDFRKKHFEPMEFTFRNKAGRHIEIISLQQYLYVNYSVCCS